MRVRWIDAAVITFCAGTGTAFARVDGLVTWPAKEQARLLKEYADFTTSAGAARDFIKDTEHYPPPHGVFTLGRDTQAGQAEMEKLVATAIAAHNLCVKDLCAALKIATDSIGAPPLSDKPGKPGKPQKSGKKGAEPESPNVHGPHIVTYEIVLPRSADLERLLAAAEKAANAKPSPTSTAARPVVAVLALLHQGKYAEAAAGAETLDGLDAALTRMAFDDAVRRYDGAHPEGHDTNELKGIEVVNAYRDALDLHPFGIDPKLHAAAKDFANDQARLGFFSHDHPSDPSKKWPSDRTKLAGYQADGVGENLSGSSDGPGSAWAWRSDAGHHSLLVMSEMHAAGLGCVGTAVLDVGSVCYAPIAPLLGKPAELGNHSAH